MLAEQARGPAQTSSGRREVWVQNVCCHGVSVMTSDSDQWQPGSRVLVCVLLWVCPGIGRARACVWQGICFDINRG